MSGVARRSFWSLLVVVLVAVNLRPAVVAVSPVLGRIRADLGLSATAAGLLTTIPVLCFGALAPAAAGVARRRGLDAAAVLAVAVLAVGCLVRVAPGTAALFLGTVLIGAGIAVGNVVVPAVVKRDFGTRTGPVMGGYSAGLSAGAALAAGLTVPLADATGGWRQALACWAVPVIATVPVVVLWAAGGRAGTGDPARAAASEPVAPNAPVAPTASAADSRRGRLRRDVLAWQVTGFMGLQSFGFYATTAWLPQILVDRGVGEAEAGWLLAVAAVCGLFASLLAPARATRRPDQVGWAVASAAGCVLGAAGLLAGLDPVVSVVLLGLGQGACFALALTFFAVRSADAAVTTRLSGMAQAGGYLFAALGPVATGWLHDVSGAWSASLTLLVVLGTAQAVLGALAGRNRVVLDKPAIRLLRVISCVRTAVALIVRDTPLRDLPQRRTCLGGRLCATSAVGYRPATGATSEHCDEDSG